MKIVFTNKMSVHPYIATEDTVGFVRLKHKCLYVVLISAVYSVISHEGKSKSLCPNFFQPQ
jgi:hypothetical protein